MLEYKGVFAKACSFPMVLFYSLEKKYILQYSTSVSSIDFFRINFREPCTAFTQHTNLQSYLDFWSFLDMPLVLGTHMDPKLLETEVGMILDLDPPEIQTPVTLGKSQGTKIFASKNFSYHPQMMLF